MSSPTSTPPSRVFLTGQAGTGKSSVAELVAKALGWRAIDTDALVVEATGRDVAAIFREDGEARFRELETPIVERAAAENNVVIATGGGALLSHVNRRAMGKGSILVCLDASPRTIFARLRQDGEFSDVRPLYDTPDPLASIIEQKARRQRFYALADVTVDTEGRSLQQVAGAVTDAVRGSDEWPSCHPERLLLPEERADPPSNEPFWVEAPSRRYPAFVGWDALDRLGELLREQGLDGAAWVVSDTEVLPRHGERALLSLREAGFQTDALAVPAGESSKSFDTATSVYDWLVSHRAERGHAIVALGGGVVGDLAGFVAATYLRGLPFVQAPTSLLAMVDAAIGGKVAVDHREGKNLVGAFYQPRLVVEDVSTLKSLPRRALIEGCAEVIKHGLILDAQLLADLEARADDVLHLDPAFTVDVVRRNVAIKGGMVARDELDTGERRLLNYGHTLGHAIEAAAGYHDVLHGEAIAAGMMAAAEIGKRMGVTPPQLVERQRALLERFGLPVRGPKLDVEAVLAAISLDKKVVAGAVNWVLLEDAGRAVLRSDVPPDLVRQVAQEVLG